LCYQLPAALDAGRTAVVISPLIALMQDQAAQLAQMGIPAAVLNSTQSAAEQAAVRRQVRQGNCRLLYISPERLARADTLAWLAGVKLSLFVIDEVHCISEWGHEFRPEYRQLGALRQRFPAVPIAAFTASATRRVRHDILQQLQLRDPDKVIASFHRANLRYVVRESPAARQRTLLHRALRHHLQVPGSLIVYAPTIQRVEETAVELAAAGIPALPYHGKMDSDTRRRHQERWMEDETRVLVGTLAFGLGINKPSVRAVIHLALPKSIEQYYQEAGRAGRDGAPADCLLLWQKRDAGLLAHFAEQIEDPAERERAWQRYHQIRGFVDTPVCRHRQICTHFGERWQKENCGACDVCGYQAGYLDAAAAAAPAASAPSSRPRRKSEAATAPVNAALLEALKTWRRETAHEMKVPAYIVLHDATLEAICHCPPRSLAELRQITGFGDRKLELYGERVLAVLAAAARRRPE
ncbi:MAG TPA: ATP-dependent DNA helicase RecQ, partial [Terriglobales bacterium]|nr:ATP-dependent DNA helicase RecQ [Terriglobales bacterium]